MPAGDLRHIPSDKPPSMMSNNSFHSSTPIVSFTVGPAMWLPRGRSCLPVVRTKSPRCSLRMREIRRSVSHSSIRASRPCRWPGFLSSTIFSCRSRPGEPALPFRCCRLLPPLQCHSVRCASRSQLRSQTTPPTRSIDQRDGSATNNFPSIIWPCRFRQRNCLSGPRRTLVDAHSQRADASRHRPASLPSLLD